MKRILPLFCLALIVTPLGAGLVPAPVKAAELGLDLKLADVVRLAAEQDRRKRRDQDNGDQHSDDNKRNDENRRDDNRRDDNNRNQGGDYRQQQYGGGNRDGRIDDAIRLASRYGSYIKAEPRGGSHFMVRVLTPDGRRVDLDVDTNSGSVSGGR